MTFRVVLQGTAVRDLDDAYRWAARAAPLTAARWLERFQVALAGLNQNPHRCAFARENSKVAVELRQHLFGRRPNVYRSIFLVEGDTVRILRILRAQRRPLTRGQIEESRRTNE
jgi:plasmid stabilization system protein ParE